MNFYWFFLEKLQCSNGIISSFFSELKTSGFECSRIRTLKHFVSEVPCAWSYLISLLQMASGVSNSPRYVSTYFSRKCTTASIFPISSLPSAPPLSPPSIFPRDFSYLISLLQMASGVSNSPRYVSANFSALWFSRKCTIASGRMCPKILHWMISEPLFWKIKQIIFILLKVIHFIYNTS